MSDVRPNVMSKYMDRRNQAFAAMSKTARRVKIEQNHTWRIRLLPVQLGPDKEPFVDIAQHWWNKAPITCPVHTSPAWGGDPNAVCPICEVSERLKQSNSEEINAVGFRARCNLRVRAWCVVFDMEDNRGNVEEMPLSEILIPYEFDMYKTTWENFAKYQKWATSGRRGGPTSEWGILDLETGCDLLATQGTKGVTLDRCDPAPIFDLNDPKYDDHIKRIWSKIHDPQIIIPTEKQLLEIALKVEEYAERGGGGGGGRSGGRGGRGGNRYEEDDRDFRRGGRNGGGRNRFDDDENDGENINRGRGMSRSRFGSEDEESAAPRSRRSAEDDAPPRRRGAQEDQEAEEPEESNAGTPPPTRRSAPQQQDNPVPSRRTASTSARAEDSGSGETEAETEAPEPPARRNTAGATARRTAPQETAEEEAVTEEDMQQDQSPTPPPSTRKGTPASAPPSARRTPATESGEAENSDGDTAPQRPPTRRAASPPPAGEGVDEEEDNAPEERRDPAPPARAPIDDAPPTEVAQTAPPPRRAAGGDIKSRLERLNQKGR